MSMTAEGCSGMKAASSKRISSCTTTLLGAGFFGRDCVMATTLSAVTPSTMPRVWLS